MWVGCYGSFSCVFCTDSNWHPFKIILNFENMKKCAGERDQGCRWLWNHWSFVFLEKLLDGEHHVCRSVVVKKSAVFVLKFSCLFTLLLIDTMKWSRRILNSLFDLTTFLKTLQYTLSVNEVIVFIWWRHMVGLNGKQQLDLDCWLNHSVSSHSHHMILRKSFAHSLGIFRRAFVL